MNFKFDKSAKINLSDRNLHKYFVFDENKKWTYFDIFKKMQNSAILCFATCYWFCPMTSHMKMLFLHKKLGKKIEDFYFLIDEVFIIVVYLSISLIEDRLNWKEINILIIYA